jgi:uncharacterized protein YbjT (DUF2867 family)
MKKIAIIGSTGMLGQPVTKEFIKAGFEVTLLARDPEKTTRIFGDTIRTVAGDLKDLNSLKELMKGQDALYINLSVEQKSGIHDFQPEREGLANILEVLKESGIKRVGYLSSLVHLYEGQNGFHWWAFEIKKDAVNKIKACGIPYSVFYPSTFMESFDKGGYRQNNNVMLAGESKYPMHLIAGSDYGKQVVKAFELDKGNNNYVVQGTEPYTADDAARLFVAHYTKANMKVMKMPFGVLKFFGMLTHKFNYGAKIIDALNNYPEKFEAETTWQELGRPQTGFLDYIKNA